MEQVIDGWKETISRGASRFINISRNIMRLTGSVRIGYAEHVACIGEMRNIYIYKKI
jgi:hypothetical protein